MNRILCRAFFALALGLTLLRPFPALAASTHLTLLLMCDMYELDARDGRGGYPRVAGVVAAERAKGGNLIVAHAGDALSPTLLSSFDKGENVVDLLNLIRPDVFVPGNHEYDFGPELFRTRMSELRFPVLAANLREATGEPVAHVRDNRMFEFDGVRVGVVGLTAVDSPVKSMPGNLVFRDSLDTLREQAKALRAAGADLIVAVSHSEREIDQRIVASRLADVLLSGDDHDLWVYYDGKVAAAEAKQDGEYVVAVDLAIDVREEQGRRRASWWPDFRIIDTATVAPDPAVAARVKHYEAELSHELDVPLGRTLTELDSRNATVRGQEAAIGDLFADAIRAATGADVAILNGGSFRANRVYPAGTEITRRDVLRELPFGNKTVILQVTGAQLRQALEEGLSQLDEPSGRFPQVSGLKVVADPAKPAGRRVVSVEVGGKPVEDGAAYTVATNDFLMRGGDGYEALRQAKVLAGERDGKLIANDVMVHIRAKGTVSQSPEGRVVLR